MAGWQRSSSLPWNMSSARRRSASRRAEIALAAADVDLGDGVILLTDMFGGTPSNLAISLLGRPNLEVIAGINLPMLIKLASVRKAKSVSEAVDLAQEAGRKYISVASRLLGEAA
jgi:PTS system mannose-specific IIA component